MLSILEPGKSEDLCKFVCLGICRSVAAHPVPSRLWTPTLKLLTFCHKTPRPPVFTSRIFEPTISSTLFPLFFHFLLLHHAQRDRQQKAPPLYFSPRMKRERGIDR